VSAGRPGEKHRKRFNRWQTGISPDTRFLSELVDAEFGSEAIKAGFERVDTVLQRADWPVDSNEIELERLHSSFIDSIYITFAKHGRPRFQIGCSRREISPPNSFVRSCHLVKHARQYYYFWGRAWWMPRFLWTNGQSRRTVNRVLRAMGQLFDFLETGERGPNISRQTAASVRHALSK